MKPDQIDPAVVRLFWAQVRKCEGGCGHWEWLGKIDKRGYGIFHIPRHKTLVAATLAWELENGVVPEGCVVLHRKDCNYRQCVRPSHLECIAKHLALHRRGRKFEIETFDEYVGSLFHVKPEIAQSLGLTPAPHVPPSDVMLPLLRQLTDATRALAGRIDALERRFAASSGDAVNQNVATELQALRALLEHRGAPDQQQPGSAVQAQSQPAAEDLNFHEALAAAFVEMVGASVHRDECPKLGQVFNAALVEAGYNDAGATTLFRSWLAAFADKVRSREVSPTVAHFHELFSSEGAGGTRPLPSRTSTQQPAEPYASRQEPESRNAGKRR